MSDERRQTSVNLDELERQLREASRARMRAQQTADALSSPSTPRPQSSQSGPSSGISSQNQLPLQGGLPLSPVQAPAPTPPVTPQPAAPSGFRPLQSPPPVAPPSRDFGMSAPAPNQPREPQSAFLSATPPRPRDLQSQFTPAADPSFSARAPEPRGSDPFAARSSSPLKTDRMGDVYPPVDTQPVVQDQYYSAAAYEEPAENAYDQYTDDQFPRIDSERRPGGVVRAAIWVLVIAIIGGGLYFSYPILQSLIMPGNQTAKAPPVIKPDPNPVKVQPETQPQAENSGAPKDIFTKHANENPSAAQVAPSPEQPVDVNAAAKNAANAAPNSRPAIVPLVPGTGEPRSVKTVVVRADGSIIAEKSDPELVAKTIPAGPKVIAMPAPVPPLSGSDAVLPPLPATPVATSPDFVLEGEVPLPPERIVETMPDITLPLDAITTPLPTTPAPEAAAPAPVAPAPAAAAPAPVTTAPGKDFAVQFGAPETEAKGNELKARVEKQFAAALTGGTVAVVRGESNGKPVFRVRAIGYSRDEASAVCQQVTAAGGQCFVSKNN